jgi:hypothetical protein
LIVVRTGIGAVQFYDERRAGREDRVAALQQTGTGTARTHSSRCGKGTNRACTAEGGAATDRHITGSFRPVDQHRSRRDHGGTGERIIASQHQHAGAEHR